MNHKQIIETMKKMWDGNGNFSDVVEYVDGAIGELITEERERAVEEYKNDYAMAHYEDDSQLS